MAAAGEHHHRHTDKVPVDKVPLDTVTRRTPGTARRWAVFRLTRWKAPTPPACHLARSGRHPDVRPSAGGLLIDESPGPLGSARGVPTS